MHIILCLVFFSLKSTFAADITAVSGLYSSREEKAGGTTVGTESIFGAGGTYHEMLNEKMAYFLTAGLDFYHYSGDAAGAPDSYTGTKLGGGLRHYFTPFNSYTVPFASANVRYQTSQSVDFSTTGYTQKRRTGLYYGASAGVRIGLSQKFFMEIELPFFLSPLQSTTKTTRVNQVAGVKTSEDTQETETSLVAKSYETLTAIYIGLGMKI